MNPLILRRRSLLATYKEKPEHMYLTFKVLQSGSFSIADFQGGIGNPAYYSTDGGSTWTAYTGGSTAVFPVDTQLLWKASGIRPSTTYGLGNFTCTGKYEAFGNIMSLVNGDNFRGTTTISQYQFAKMFSGDSSTGLGSLVSAENLILPATQLQYNCYWNMFRNNYSFTKAPKLPALNLAERCYIGMFGYTIITEAPELPATTLYQQCYQGMFDGCRQLTKAPDLPAPTIAYDSYDYMFRYDENLNYVKCLATSGNSTSNCTYWLEGVASSGTFVKASSASWSRSTSGIPSAWTIENA